MSTIDKYEPKEKAPYELRAPFGPRALNLLLGQYFCWNTDAQNEGGYVARVAKCEQTRVVERLNSLGLIAAASTGHTEARLGFDAVERYFVHVRKP